MQQAVRADPIRIALAAAVPLGVLALAYAAWAVSDRIGSIGPLDKAKLGWLIVVPLLGLAPVGAAFAWRSLTNREATAAAVAMAAPLAIATTLLFWLATAHPDCQFGSRMSELDALGISAGVGVLTGAGYASAASSRVA